MSYSDLPYMVIYVFADFIPSLIPSRQRSAIRICLLPPTPKTLRIGSNRVRHSFYLGSNLVML